MVAKGDVVSASSVPTVELIHEGEHRRVLAVTGSVDRRGVEDLRDACRPEQVPVGATVVVDFTGMTGCPSALLLALVRIRDRLGSTRTLQLVGLTEALESIALGGTPAR
jgi:hypothetical protein